MKTIMYLAIILMLCATPLMAEETEPVEEATPIFVVTQVDQYTQHQGADDRTSKDLAIYQYYNSVDSRGNVPVIEGDTQEYHVNSVQVQDAVNLKPVVNVTPF